MTPIVLIHGAWHGSWCWERIAPLLEQAGYLVIAPDLPGQASFKGITLDHYALTVAKILGKFPGKALLVGHSFGGMVISRTAELVPEKISHLVYLSAFLPQNGDSFFSLAHAFNQDATPFQLQINKAMNRISVINPNIEDILFHDAIQEDKKWAKSLLQPCPLMPLIDRILITSERFGSLPRTYVLSLQDKTLSPKAQDAMLRRTPCPTLQMDCGHSPFLSNPQDLARILLSISALLHK